MNLLPKSHQDFAQKDYWNAFFQKLGNKSFEWYGEYAELCGHLHKYVKQKDNILMVGCGNSKLSMDLYDIGYRQITNIDISQLVIKQMKELNKRDRPDMEFLQMDATEMSDFENDKFSVVIDKGTLDALMPDGSVKVIETIHKYWSEISRVLRIGGRYICISLLQEHIIKELVEYFPIRNWMFRVIRCIEAEQVLDKSNSKTSKIDSNHVKSNLPVFMIIASKFQKLPFPVLEICMAGDKINRLQHTNEIIESVLSVQKASLVCSGLRQCKITELDEVSMDLYRPGEKTPRFTVHIIDQQFDKSNGQFAVFIVPQGREIEWLFSTPQGRLKLAASAQYDRLGIVSMHRDQIYTTWDDIKYELSDCIKNFAQTSCTGQIPYLSLGSEVGNRETIFKGHSEFSGDYIVEEITGHDGKTFRRLVFLNNQFVLQSEALVKTVKLNDRTEKKIVDPSYLACQHHLYMSIGVNAITRNPSKKKIHTNEIIVIGLGGGGLCMFLHQCLREITITAIDIDPAILTIATNYFGLTQDDRLKVIINDGIEFILSAAKNNQSYKAILFDVDSKDPTIGLSCPPKHFLDKKVLDAVKLCLGHEGLFILNLVCRDEQLRDIIVNDLKASFQSICSYRLDEDINEILYCRQLESMDQEMTLNDWSNSLKTASEEINQLTKQFKLNKSTEDLIDVESFLNELKV